MEDLLWPHRTELTGYCYRMLGSAVDAEDAVQETAVRAWRTGDRFDPQRAARRTWLYAIATNICLDLLRGRRRRALAMDLGPSARAGDPLGVPLPESAWVQPVPDALVLPAGGDPAELAVLRESVRLAFVAALQVLPPRQRAVLILREVLCWTAAEVAALLDSSVPAVNSALQRARATLGARAAGHVPDEPARPAGGARDDLVDRYVDAFTRYDVEALVALLREDAVMSMPPFPWWLRGREEIRRALVGSAGACRGDRLVPTAANGRRAFGQYRAGPGGHVAFALLVIEPAAGGIAAVTTHLNAVGLFGLFGLPERLAPVESTAHR